VSSTTIATTHPQVFPMLLRSCVQTRTHSPILPLRQVPGGCGCARGGDGGGAGAGGADGG
jgi:hypothetical protein